MAAIGVGAAKEPGGGEPKGVRGSRPCWEGNCGGLFCHCGTFMVAHTIPVELVNNRDGSARNGGSGPPAPITMM